ncbi:hypothetical protein [Maridesulfovibrio sp.]|uniref:hypothetical protein n=1 Tax=Maridesulfovibrio sp. TaxID=2795000 RepID=UPI0029CA882D|nr:hypothetical protein [Maridesulfovibrio sp.]
MICKSETIDNKDQINFEQIAACLVILTAAYKLTTYILNLSIVMSITQDYPAAASLIDSNAIIWGNYELVKSILFYVAFSLAFTFFTLNHLIEIFITHKTFKIFAFTFSGLLITAGIYNNNNEYMTIAVILIYLASILTSLIKNKYLGFVSCIISSIFIITLHITLSPDSTEKTQTLGNQKYISVNENGNMTKYIPVVKTETEIVVVNKSGQMEIIPNGKYNKIIINKKSSTQ